MQSIYTPRSLFIAFPSHTRKPLRAPTLIAAITYLNLTIRTISIVSIMIEDQQDLVASLEHVEEAMAKMFPLNPGLDELASRGPFTDDEVRSVCAHLKQSGKPEWSLRPRTYIILRMLDGIELMNDFIREGLFDTSLPYSEKTLPGVVGTAAREQFLKFQTLVLTAQRLDLESGRGDHAYVKDDSLTQLEHCVKLGSGGFGSVDKVRSRLSNNEYARKKIPRGKTFKKDKIAIATFERELQTLKRLSHTHLVKFVGSYTDTKYVCIIMSPVADCNLAQYLQEDPLPEDRKEKLQTFFGCLCAALVYLHENHIRHKDIKPGNILIHGDNVIFTDFGTALDWSEQGQSTTRDRPEALSVAYCAPEVAEWEPRNSSSDIWSLGCVFLEIITVMRGKTIGEMREFFRSNGLGGTYVRTNASAAEMWTRELHSQEGIEREPLGWFKDMTSLNRTERPSALQLLDRIKSSRKPHSFIGKCCMSNTDESDPSDSESESSDEEEDTPDSWEVVTRQQDLERANKLLLDGGFDLDDENFDATQTLWWALNTEDIEVVRLVISRGADIDAVLPHGQTSLQEALKTENVAIAKLLLSLGANITKSGRHGYTAVTWALRWGNIEVLSLMIRKGSVTEPQELGKIMQWATLHGEAELVRLLIVRGANPNDMDSRGQPVLHTAITRGKDDVAKVLIDYGADLAAQNNVGETPLHFAATYAREDIATLLVNKGARVNALSHHQRTPLIKAIQGGSMPIVKLLLEKGANVAARSPFEGLPVCLAAGLGHVEMVDLLLERGEAVKAKTCSIETVVVAAVMKGRDNVVRHLIGKGVSPHVTQNGITSLHKAAENGSDALVQLLLEQSADTEAAEPEEGMTPLHSAAKNGHEGVVRLLLEHGAKVDTKTSKLRWTALHYAIDADAENIARVLVEKGADVNAKADNGRTPLQLASNSYSDNQSELVELLLKSGAQIKSLSRANIESSLRRAVEGGSTELVRVILETGPSLQDMKGYNCVQGEMPLMEALRHKHKEITIMLFDKQAKTEGISQFYWAPALHWAAEEDHLPLAQRAYGSHDLSEMQDGTTAPQKAAKFGSQRVLDYMLGQEGNVNVLLNTKSEEGKTALHYAAEQGHVDAVKALLKRGANKKKKTRGGLTALQLAIDKGHKVVEELLDK